MTASLDRLTRPGRFGGPPRDDLDIMRRIGLTLLRLLSALTLTVGVDFVLAGNEFATAAPVLSFVDAKAVSHGRVRALGPGTVTVLHVPSADNDLPVRDVYVYRPDVPPGTPLPVLYMLHGYPGHPPAIMRWMAPALDAAFTGGAAPFVVAVPDGNGHAYPDTEWADSVDGKTLVETSLISKILPAVEGPTPLPRGRRAIGGFSMGGYGAANLGLRHPDLFGQIVAISGYYHTDDESGVFNNDPAVLAANTPDANVPALAGRRVQLIESKSETDPLIKGEAAEFAARVRGCGCAAAVDLRLDAGDHDVDFVGAETPNLVAFLDAGWTAPPPPKSNRKVRGGHRH